MVTLKKIVSVVLMPLLYANLAGLAVGAVWLGLAAQWQLMGIGVIALLFSPYIIPLLMIPAGIFAHFMIIYQTAGRRGRERLMFFLSIGYILLFMTLWCVGIFQYVTQGVRPDALGAGLLWANVVALAPLLLWINRDRGNDLMMLLVEMAQITLLTLSAVRWFGGAASFWQSFAVFGGIMAIIAVVQAIYEKKWAPKPGETSR